jgi:ribosomal protein L37AE/L43A
MEKKIGFIPLTPDVFTMDNCSICGSGLDDKDVQKGMLICQKCRKTLAGNKFEEACNDACTD